MDVDFKFYLVTDRTLRTPNSLHAVVGQAINAGVRAIQLREKDLSAKQLYELAAKMSAQLRDTGCKFIINDRLDVATCANADGVHLTSRSLPTAIARCYMPADKLIGVSTHSLPEILQAADAGANFVLFGPIFETPSKLAYGAPQGLKSLSRVACKSDIPVFAIGGVSPGRAKICMEHGAAGVAAISSVMAASNVEKVVERYKMALQGL